MPTIEIKEPNRVSRRIVDYDVPISKDAPLFSELGSLKDSLKIWGRVANPSDLNWRICWQRRSCLEPIKPPRQTLSNTTKETEIHAKKCSFPEC